MTETIKIIEAIGQQWPFLIVLFIITVFIIYRKAIGRYISNISSIKIKKGENEISIDREIPEEIKTEIDISQGKISDIKIISGLQLLSKSEASQILFKKLYDPNVSNIKIITYTNEVEAGQINNYKVRGKKTIEIYKRSIISDLYEQQKTNIDRVLNNEAYRPWKKNKKIVESTTLIEQEFSNNPDVKVIHYFYDYPPTKRAYIFDDKEAIYSYYECLETKNGSIYKGMGELGRLWISLDSLVGNYLLKELLNDVRLLKSHSRSIDYENFLLNNHLNAIYSSLATPVLKLKAVFLDMDGILYDSLWQYKIAWREAFRSHSIEISDKDVYLHEGRSGAETINFLYNQYLNREPEESEISEIIKIRNQVLLRYGKPKPQEGIIELLKKITSNELDIFLVTGSSSKKIKYDIVVDFNGLIKEENIISGLDVKIGKPNPEPYFIAMHRAKLKPSEIVVIEDAPLGIESAKSAGIYTIAINTGILDNSILANSGADNIFNSCIQLSNSWPEIFDILNT